MSRVCELHDKSMDLLNEALKFQASGWDERAQELFHKAYELEKTAAYLVKKAPESEPSRGMLFLGAASLAATLAEYEIAQQLVLEGLSGYPTIAVRNDLVKLAEEIKERFSPRGEFDDMNQDESYGMRM